MASLVKFARQQSTLLAVRPLVALPTPVHRIQRALATDQSPDSPPPRTRKGRYEWTEEDWFILRRLRETMTWKEVSKEFEELKGVKVSPALCSKQWKYSRQLIREGKLQTRPDEHAQHMFMRILKHRMSKDPILEPLLNWKPRNNPAAPEKKA